MKKILSVLLLALAFVATASAQYITVYENETLIRKYDMQEHKYEVTFEKHNPQGEEAEGNGKISVYEDGQLKESFIDCENKSYKVTRDNVAREGAMAKINGEQVWVEYVQLWDGGPKWATMNVGATEVAGTKVNSHTGELDCYGEYYAWGDTSPKDDYKTETLQYSSNDKTTLELKDDAANVNWGGNWRMPTDAELTALINNCYWEWTESYNNVSVKGYIVYKVKSHSDKGLKKNSYSSPTTVGTYSLSDNHIFLPAAGYRFHQVFSLVGNDGHYWSSSLSNSSYACYSYFGSSYVNGNKSAERIGGRSVRPVCP